MNNQSKVQQIRDTYGHLTPLEMAETFSTTLAYVNRVLRQAGVAKPQPNKREQDARKRS